MNSESEYQVQQEGSGEDFDPSEDHIERLRPHSRQKNYQAIFREPKPAVEKRLTRGIHNPIPSELTNTNYLGDLEEQVDEDGVPKASRQDDEGNAQDEDQSSIFNPEVGLILWRRNREGTDELEYLVKLKGRSYLHTLWLTEAQIESMGKPIRNKINRFNKNFMKKIQDMNYDEDAIMQGKYFDPSFLEVDRILTATQMFPVIHQKKANEIKGKWSESLAIVCSKLLNFTKNNIHYGVLFCQPVNPQSDNCPQYTKIVQHPMDLGTILNKVYLDIYKSSKQFWHDIGLVWKNCLKYNKEQNSDLRLLGLTQRQCTIFLYNQWYHLCEQRYNKLKSQLSYLYDDKKENRVNGETILEEQQQIKLDSNVISDNNNNQHNQLSHQQSNNIQINIIDKKPEENHQQQHNNNQQQHQQEKQPPIKQKQQENQLNNQQKQQDKKSQYESSQEQIQEKIEEENNDDQAKWMETPHSSKKNDDVEDEREVLNMDDFFEKNIFITTKKVQTPTTKEELQLLNPVQFNYSWLEEGGVDSGFMSHSYEYIDVSDMKVLDINVEVNKLYMVKWKNLSYSQATWQLESAIAAPDKIAEFKLINKTLGKDHRTLMQTQMEKHNILLDIQSNIKKRRNYSAASLAQIKNKLYSYDIASRKQPYQYNSSNIPVYRNYKLLRSYQLDSLNWLIRSWYEGRNTILADEMGLGKTIQSIAFLYHLYTFQNVKGPFLVIAPLSTLEHWKRTVEEWTTLNQRTSWQKEYSILLMVSHKHYHEGKLSSISAQQVSNLLTSYEVFLLDFNPVIINIPFQFVIVDEAHRLKNKNAKILATLKRLPCRRVLLLTGTPIQNNTVELWSLLNYIEPNKFTSFDDFKRQFGDLSTNEQN